MADMRKQPIEVVNYDPTWPKQFQSEAEKVRPIFGDNVVEIHHIGSTAIPGMTAKPTIDMILEVNDINAVDQQNAEMEKLGYEAWGEYHLPGRRFFVKGTDKRTHHIHTFESGSEQIARHLYFRDYLIAHPKEAKKYAEIKKELAEKHRDNRRAYVTEKGPFVLEIERKAGEWAKQN